MKIARPPWQAHCNLLIEGLNVRDFFWDLSHADLNADETFGNDFDYEESLIFLVKLFLISRLSEQGLG